MSWAGYTLTRHYFFFPEVWVYSLLRCKHAKGLKEKGEGAHLMSDSPLLQLMPHFCLAGCFSAAMRKVALPVACMSWSELWRVNCQEGRLLITSFSWFSGDATYYVSLPSAEEVVERILPFQIGFWKCNSALRRWYHGLLFLLSQWFQVILSQFQSKHGDCIHLLFFLCAMQFETGCSQTFLHMMSWLRGHRH